MTRFEIVVLLIQAREHEIIQKGRRVGPALRKYLGTNVTT